MTRSAPGRLLKDMMHKRNLSSRSLASGAGISEAVIRNMLSHGIEASAKDPDPRTLLAVANYLDVEPEVMFRMVGYIDEKRLYSARGEYLAHVFDSLPPERQSVLIHTAEALAEDVDLKQSLKAMRANPDDESYASAQVFPKGWNPLLRYTANALMSNGQLIDIGDIERISPDTKLLNGRTISELDPNEHLQLLKLIRAKLAVDWQEFLRDYGWDPDFSK